MKFENYDLDSLQKLEDFCNTVNRRWQDDIDNLNDVEHPIKETLKKLIEIHNECIVNIQLERSKILGENK